MNKQQEKVFNETRIRNLKRRYAKCIDKGEIEAQQVIVDFEGSLLVVTNLVDGTIA